MDYTCTIIQNVFVYISVASIHIHYWVHAHAVEYYGHAATAVDAYSFDSVNVTTKTVHTILPRK